MEQMETQKANEIQVAYKALVEAVGIKFDEKNANMYLKYLVDKCVDYGFEKANTSLDGFKKRVTRLENDLVKARDVVRTVEKEKEGFRYDLKCLRSEEVQSFREECKIINRENKPSKGDNPFHDAVEDFLSQLEAHNITDECKGQVLSSFINSMGYLYWQNAKESKRDGQDYEPLRAGRTI